jgi:ubiquinone/menaquinone biosynthesis C-methylase UbiE
MTAGDKIQVDYTGISKTYDDYRSYPDDVIKRIIELGQIGRGQKVLDLGCGTGNISRQIKNNVDADFIGVDSSLDMLKVAKSKSLEVLGSDIDNRHLPFCDSSFDSIVGAYIIHQIKNLHFMLSECWRVIREGRLVLLTSSQKQIEDQHPIMKEFFPSYINVDKSRFPDIDRIYSLLESMSFKEISHEEVTVANLPIDREYLQKVKNKYVSTYHLIPQNEFNSGVAKLEAFIINSRQPQFRDWRATIISGSKILN